MADQSGDITISSLSWMIMLLRKKKELNFPWFANLLLREQWITFGILCETLSDQIFSRDLWITNDMGYPLTRLVIATFPKTIWKSYLKKLPTINYFNLMAIFTNKWMAHFIRRLSLLYRSRGKRLCETSLPTLYRKYVDDILPVMESVPSAKSFLDKLSRYHSSLHFTIELAAHNNELHF